MTGQCLDRERAGPLLVIGYGSELRGDDAVGLRIAQRAAEWRNPCVEAVAVHQLLPELAEAVSAARAVVFVDADVSTRRVEIRPVGQLVGADILGHTGDPAWLMAMADGLFGTRPDAWQLGVPVSDMDMRMSLSEQAEDAIGEALRELTALAAQYGVAGEGCHA